ncbi:MAG: thiamine pyrophosphate-dependent dehydrogenase E1 component subunit alpha [Anaerolineae bacterium]|nr:thiamine pyrophosphate-dependent dehydrogenase E1 component subunit alpha [Anaerolineae bacterium]
MKLTLTNGQISLTEKRRLLKELGGEKARWVLQTMHTIRAFEEKAEELYALGKIHGTMHLSIGMEASAVGSILALQPDDLILSTHRGHGHCIAKGADLKRMMAEFMGKACGYCRGRGGSMHIADVKGGNLGANGVVGGGLPLAIGVGLGLKMEGKRRIHLCFFGDGAASNGAFHESLNMAAIYHLPVVYVCENNQYAMSFSVKKSCPLERISDRAAAYAMPGATVDGNDVLSVYAAVRQAVERARQQCEPSLVENVTYRWRGHSKSDANRYRTKEEIEAWKAKDPIRRFEELLTAESILTPSEAQEIKEAAYRSIDEAAAYAESCAEPDLDTIEEGVYA